jgi:hypothetical protein
MRNLPMKSARFDAAAIAARRTVSRRTFVHSAAGALVAGGTLGNGMLRSAFAQAPSPSDPVPIPGGTPALGGAFHVFAPAAIDAVDAEPVTITDFNGFVGLAYVSGMVTRRRRSTGEVKQYPFVDSDMRFMQGVYRGVDGRVRRGTFGLI